MIDSACVEANNLGVFHLWDDYSGSTDKIVHIDVPCDAVCKERATPCCEFNRPFPSSLVPLFQNESYSFIWNCEFDLHENATYRNL